MLWKTILLTGCLAFGLLAQEAPPRRPAPTVETLIERLGSDDFATRSQATEDLRALGSSARPALEKAAKSKNLEQQTRAQSLLDALDAAEAPSASDRRRQIEPLRPEGLPGRPKAPRAVPQDLLDQMRARMRRLERDLSDPRRPDASDRLRSFGELEKQLRSRLEALPGLRQELRFGPGGGPGVQQKIMMRHEGERLSFESGQEGVTFSVTPQDGGETKTYTAADLEALKKEHPEIYERYEASGIFRAPANIVIDGFPSLQMPGLPFAARDRGPRLGVVVNPVPAVLRDHVDIPDEAMVVERVQPGSLAARLGLRTHDVLLRIDGQAIGSSGAIRRALRQGEERQDELEIDLIRKGRPLSLSGPRPRKR